MELKILIVLISLVLFYLFLKISKKLFYLIFILLGVFLFVLVTGCSKGERLNLKGNLEPVEENTLTRIEDIPFPPNTQIDVERSLILGEGKTWSGQLLAYVAQKKRKVFNFYVNNFEDYGWKEQTTIRGEVSILNYVGENNRVAIISIREKRFNRSEILISVSPYTEEFEQKVGDFINEKYLELPFTD